MYEIRRNDRDFGPEIAFDGIMEGTMLPFHSAAGRGFQDIPGNFLR